MGHALPPRTPDRAYASNRVRSPRSLLAIPAIPAVSLLLLLGLLSLACGNTSGTDRDCDVLCEKITGCQENHPRARACPWIVDEDEAFCRDACEETAEESNLVADCVECLAENLSCGGTASVRECDSACEATMYVTGMDGEDAASYAFTTYFCEEDELVDVGDDDD